MRCLSDYLTGHQPRRRLLIRKISVCYIKSAWWEFYEETLWHFAGRRCGLFRRKEVVRGEVTAAPDAISRVNGWRCRLESIFNPKQSNESGNSWCDICLLCRNENRCSGIIIQNKMLFHELNISELTLCSIETFKLIYSFCLSNWIDYEAETRLRAGNFRSHFHSSASPRRVRVPFIPYRNSVLTWLLKDSLHWWQFQDFHDCR